MVESDSLLDTVELVAIINKNKIEQQELTIRLERSGLLFMKRRK